MPRASTRCSSAMLPPHAASRRTAVSRFWSRIGSAPFAWPTSLSSSTGRTWSRSVRTTNSWPGAVRTPSCTASRRPPTGETGVIAAKPIPQGHKTAKKRSELQTQAEVDLARRRLPVQDARHGADCPHSACRINVGRWHGKVGMIESIHHDEAKLQAHILSHGEILSQSKVQVGNAWTFQDVESRVAESAHVGSAAFRTDRIAIRAPRDLEGRGVEPAAQGALAGGKVSIADPIWPPANGVGVRRIPAGKGGIKILPGLQVDIPARLPASQKPFDPAAGATQEALTSSEGKGVNRVAKRAMLQNQCVIGFLDLTVVLVLNHLAAKRRAASTGVLSVGQVPRPGPPGAE